MTDILTVPEAAQLLRVARKTLYEALSRGQVPHRRIGKRIVLHRSVLMEWLGGKNEQV